MFVIHEMAINEPRHPSPVRFVLTQANEGKCQQLVCLYASFYATLGPDNTPSGRHFAGNMCSSCDIITLFGRDSKFANLVASSGCHAFKKQVLCCSYVCSHVCGVAEKENEEEEKSSWSEQFAMALTSAYAVQQSAAAAKCGVPSGEVWRTALETASNVGTKQVTAISILYY